MLKTKKKGFLQLLFSPIFLLLIILIIIILVFIPKGDFLSIVSSKEDEYKRDYATVWTSRSDDDFSIPCKFLGEDTSLLSPYIATNPPAPYCATVPNSFYYKGNNIKCSGDRDFRVNSATEDQYMVIRGGGSCSLTKRLKGQEIVIVGNQHTINYPSGSRIHGLQINGAWSSGSFSTAGGDYFTQVIPHTLEPSKYDIVVNGIFKETINAEEGIELTMSGVIYHIGKRAQFKCDLAPDEVWVQEAFAQPFNINALSFPPVKFCKETRPFTLRDIQQGETNIIPDPIPAFNRGETLTPLTNSIIVANYATPNVPGVTNPCPPDSANIKIAGKWACSQIIKTTTITREVPIREIIKVSGANTFSFSTANKNQFNIGSSVFSAHQNFNCQFPNDIDIINFPNPSADCYSSAISYEAASYAMKDKDLISLNDNILVQYFAGGSLRRTDRGIEDKLQGTYIFNIINPLEISVEGGLSFKHNSSGKVQFIIKNNLPSGDILIKSQQKIKKINQMLPEREGIIKAVEGINNYEIEVDTSNLGINEIILQAFYPVEADGKVLLPSDKIIISVEILGEQPSIIKFVEKPIIVEKEVIITVERPSLLKSFIQWIKRLILGLS